MRFIDLHPLNASDSTFDTFSGIAKSFSDSQPLKALAPIVFKVFGSVMSFRFLHSVKHSSSILSKPHAANVLNSSKLPISLFLNTVIALLLSYLEASKSLNVSSQPDSYLIPSRSSTQSRVSLSFG